MSYPVFADGDILYSTDMNAVGLWLVKTQAIGSGVASIAVNSAFSSQYDNYKIIVSGGVASGDIGIQFQLGSTATGYYGTYIYSAYSGTSVLGFNTNNGANWPVGASSSAGHQVNIDLLNPFLAKRTSYGGFNQNTTSNAGPITGYLANSTSYTGFTLTTTSGTLTGGTIYVYGFRY